MVDGTGDAQVPGTLVGRYLQRGYVGWAVSGRDDACPELDRLLGSRGERPVLASDRVGTERVPVVSTGVAARVNLFGYAVVERLAAGPIQRTRDRGYGVQLAPGG